MPINKSQSTIREARDQLFLDTADGTRLNTVTGNLGLTRPTLGLNDDTWRAVAKAIMLQPKLVPDAFQRVLEAMLGPQTTRVAQLSVASQIGESIIQLADASDLTQVGTLVFDSGLPTQETVGFCFRDLETNKVFLNSALQYAHNTLDTASSVLRTAVTVTDTTLELVDSSLFPTTGYPYAVVVSRGLDVEEIFEISDNNTSTNTLTCSAATNAHAAAMPQFIRKTLQNNVPIGQLFVQLGSNATRVFPTSGWIRLDGSEVAEYTANDITESVLTLKRPLTSAHSAGVSVGLMTPGATVETVSVLQNTADWSLYETEDYKVKIYLPEELYVLRLLDSSWFHNAVPSGVIGTPLAVDTTATDTDLEVGSVATFPDEAGLIRIDGTLDRFYILRDEDATPNPILTLPYAVGQIFTSGSYIYLIQEVYSGTDLEEGNLRDSGGVVQANQFSGPYIYDVLERAPSLVSTTLATAILPPTRTAFPTTIGQTCMEVEDVFRWPAPPFTAFSVKLGAGSGSVEETTVTDRVLKTVSTTVSATPSPNPGALVIQGTDTQDFPKSNGTNLAGYRLIIDRGGSNEEIVTVDQNSDAAPGDFTLTEVTEVSHSIGESIELLNDVLTFSPLTEPHEALQVTPTVEGHLIEALTDEIELADGTDFPLTGGTVLLNFGKGRINARTKITNIPGASSLDFDDTSIFPTTNFPYMIKVGVGLPTEERAWVSANDTGLDRLTLSAALVGTFAVGDYVTFETGDPISVTYSERSGTTLTLTTVAALAGGFTVGETVTLSPSYSENRTNGYDYPLLMPPDPAANLVLVLDLVRAAGIEVEFLSDR